MVAARKAAGMTQRDVAEKLGKPPSLVAKVESTAAAALREALLTPEKIQRQQATRAKRLAAADAVVCNGAGNSLLQLEQDVRALAASFGL